MRLWGFGMLGTHVLNEEVFGTVAFIGLSRANTWDFMGLLDCRSSPSTGHTSWAGLSR